MFHLLEIGVNVLGGFCVGLYVRQWMLSHAYSKPSHVDPITQAARVFRTTKNPGMVYVDACDAYIIDGRLFWSIKSGNDAYVETHQRAQDMQKLLVQNSKLVINAVLPVPPTSLSSLTHAETKTHGEQKDEHDTGNEFWG